jgi:hypothetical protein
MRMTPYTTSGTYTSKVYDAGVPVTWDSASWTATGTVSVSVRTSADGITWGAWVPLTASGPLPASLASVQARYAQYQLSLTGTTTATPAVNGIVLTFSK